ncbi:MAG: extracellular solute-binding protein, partial [Clostridia bacterium]
MRKNRTLLVALVLLLVMLLPSNSFATPQEGHLEIWSMLTQVERADSFEKMARNYEAAHPGITINVTVMPWSGALDKLVAAIMAGNAPDITVVGNGYPQTLAGMGGLVELSEVVEKVGGTDAFLGTSLTVQGAYENGLYAMPLYVTPYVAYYRQSWLDKAGIESTPTTWEEYYEMCKAVTNPAENRYGFALPLGDLHGWKTIWSFLQCNGVDIVNVDEDGAWYVDMNDESRAAMIETYDYLYKLCKDCAPEGIV